MKKISTYLFLIFLSHSSLSLANDISDFQIGGISIGDSLLKYLSKSEIIKEIENTKNAYEYLTAEFGEVYIYDGNLGNYEMMSFFVKLNDKKYNIYSIRGMIGYDDNIAECYVKKKEIEKEISLMFKNVTREQEDFVFPWDPTGKSHVLHEKFIFNSEDQIWISCAEYEKSLKIKNNWEDGLSVSVKTKEVSDWLRNHIK
tara:strand:- start:65 stop:664 length:600 start_codon:yes stop_codon:yes gene_type:complete